MKGRRAEPLVAALVILSAFVVAAAASADFADGLRAYDGGDYASAAAEWSALAEAGDAGAQSALAGLYRQGLGVAADPGLAARWYRRAAEQGEANAQLNLGELHARGIGVPRDLVEAYLWYSLAAEQGRVWAARERAKLVPEMADAELAKALARLAERRKRN